MKLVKYYSVYVDGLFNSCHQTREQAESLIRYYKKTWNKKYEIKVEYFYED